MALYGVLTIAAALSYGELASMMPAGGMYVYLREAFSPVCGYLYGWTLSTVIQNGHHSSRSGGVCPLSRRAASCRFRAAHSPPSLHIKARYVVSLSSAQLVAILVIVLLTWTNCKGIRYGKDYPQ